MSSNERLVDCGVMSPEQISRIVRAVNRTAAGCHAEHEKKGRVIVEIFVEHSALTNEVIVCPMIEETLKDRKPGSMGLFRDGRIVEPGTGELSDSPPRLERVG